MSLCPQSSILSYTYVCECALKSPTTKISSSATFRVFSIFDRTTEKLAEGGEYVFLAFLCCFRPYFRVNSCSLSIFWLDSNLVMTADLLNFVLVTDNCFVFIPVVWPVYL